MHAQPWRICQEEQKGCVMTPCCRDLGEGAMSAVKKYMMEICDDCYALEGEACHNPDCAFYCHNMETVG